MTDFNEIESMIQEKISTCSAQEEIKDITVNLEKAEDTSEDSVNKEVVKKTKKEIVKAVKTENIIEEPSTNTVTSDKILEKKKATSQSEQQGKTETYHV